MGRRAASLLAASGMAAGMLFVAVCLMGLLSSHTGGPDASTVLRAARPVHVVPDGHRHPIGRTAPTAFAEETDETTDEHPAKAELLTALLSASFFGAIAWVPNSASSALPGPGPSRRPASFLFYSVVRLLQRRALATLSGVFRL